MNPTDVENMNFVVRAFKEGGPVMFMILTVAILALFVVIDRIIKFSTLIIDKREFSDQIYRFIMAGDLRQAISFCDARPAPLSNIVKSGLVQALNKRPDEEIQVAMDASVMREMPKLEGWTGFLAVFGNISVLIGLLGTIFGMISSFRAVAAADPATKAEELSKGIAHALNCTGFGLLVAIMSIVAYGYFQHKTQRAEDEMIETSMTLLNLIAANRDKMKD